METRIKQAIDNRDLGTAQELLNELYEANKAAGLVIIAPNPAGPEGARKRCLKLFAVLRDEIEENDMIDPKTGALWDYKQVGDVEYYEKLEG